MIIKLEMIGDVQDQNKIMDAITDTLRKSSAESLRIDFTAVGSIAKAEISTETYEIVRGEKS
ncbi:hypothetical protein B0E33_01320 [Roseibium algicola]|uniref:4-oxalocrotonate tautomerase n=1 Tax=Roseibium algicola TaxID=2857014 RepID=A0ABM6HWZ7_9HYPH|nr:hypothetical protein [Roseibium aggregatum]AQQ02395.1 hypothetical protein B0E33_01320 [Roseibium aggregatum]